MARRISAAWIMPPAPAPRIMRKVWVDIVARRDGWIMRGREEEGGRQGGRDKSKTAPDGDGSRNGM